MKKLRPSNYYNIEKIESWLYDMAAEGYFLQTMDKNFCEFEKGEPKTISYRVEIATEGKDLSREQHLKYTRDLWTNVASFSKFHVFSCPYEFINPEPNPSPKDLAKSLRPIFLKTCLQLLLVIICAIIFFRFFPYFINANLILATLRGSSIDIVTFILLAFSIVTLCKEAYFQGKLLLKLSKGTPINHHKPWKKSYWFSYGLWGCKIILITIIALCPLTLAYSYRHQLTDNNIHLPILRLSEVETINGSSFDESLLEGGSYIRKWSILAPIQYEAFEYTSNVTDNSIENEYFKLTFPSTQKYIVDALVSQVDKFYTDIDYGGTGAFKTEPIPVKNIDYLIYREEPNRGYDNHVFAAKDGIILHIRYYGDKTKEDLINAVHNFFNVKLKEV